MATRNKPLIPLSCVVCRRRKIKCDKQQPCDNCVKGYYDCSYPEPARKKRKQDEPSQRLGDIEARLRALEAGSLDGTESAAGHSTSSKSNMTDLLVEANPIPHQQTETNEESIEFQGSVNQSFIQDLKETLQEWPGDIYTLRNAVETDGHNTLVEFLESARGGNKQRQAELPSRDVALKLVTASIEAQRLVPILHEPSFYSSFDEVYATSGADWGKLDKAFIPLLYAVLAHGSLYAIEEEGGAASAIVPSPDSLVAEGLKYFTSAKLLVDPSDCQELTTLQALLFMDLFSLSICRSQVTYTYLCTTMSTVLRMGLHRSARIAQSTIAQETGRRIFWAARLCMAEIAVSCGLPRFPQDSEITQAFPEEVDDDKILDQGILPTPEGETSYMAAAGRYRDLFLIRDQADQKLAQIKLSSPEQLGMAQYLVMCRQVDEKLQGWRLKLPSGYQLGHGAESASVFRDQFLLVISFTYVHLSFSRPLLQIVLKSSRRLHAKEKNDGDNGEIRRRASLCVLAAEKIISLCTELVRHGLVERTLWPLPRILFRSILTLLYTALISPKSDDLNTDSLLRNVVVGKRALERLARSSHPSARCISMFEKMIETLPKDFESIKESIRKQEALLTPVVPQEPLYIRYDSGLILLVDEVFALTEKPSNISRDSTENFTLQPSPMLTVGTRSDSAALADTTSVSMRQLDGPSTPSRGLDLADIDDIFDFHGWF